MGYKARIVFAVVKDHSETHRMVLGFYKRKREAVLDCEKLNRQTDLFTQEDQPKKAQVARYAIGYDWSISAMNRQIKNGFNTIPILAEVQDKRRHA